MNCPYCRATNLADEHRCQRCGRRFDFAPNPSSRQAYGREATARALQPDSELEAPGATSTVETDSHRRRAYQPSLFQTRIVSFDAYAPEAAEPRRKSRGSAKQRQKAPIPGQESFPFDTVISQAVPVAARGAEASISCGACVASPAHRLVATAVDAAFVTISLGLFALMFYLFGGQLVFDIHSLPLCIGMAVIFFVMYELFWCMAGTETAGMHWAHLEVVNFDGLRPDREQRLFRMASAWLSLLAAGLGVLWALVDEESLTWHDHISKTFPTPRS